MLFRAAAARHGRPEGTLCKYATAYVDTPQPFPTRNFSGTRYFLFRRDGTGTVPVPYRFFDSSPRTFFLPWHGMLPDAAAMEVRTPDVLTVRNTLCTKLHYIPTVYT